MPNFARLASAGSFAPLGTTVPPQSPVAWSTFITGLDPGGHGIFDFIHRDPDTMEPFLSTTKTAAGGRTLTVGAWQFPLSGGTVELLRRGQPFWEVLEDRGVETTIVRMPANFPPSGARDARAQRHGYARHPRRLRHVLVLHLGAVRVRRSGRSPAAPCFRSKSSTVASARALEGPDNPFRTAPEKVRADFVADVDATRRYVKLVVGAEERMLKVGEWSDWLPVELPLMPSQTLGAEARFYLKGLDPVFRAVRQPAEHRPAGARDAGVVSGRLRGGAGAGHRPLLHAGMPEDTKSLQTGVLGPDEFLEQARIAGDENRRQYQYVLDRFTGGFLFYYFGNVDQVSHMMWRPRDPGHPAYDEAADRRHARGRRGRCTRGSTPSSARRPRASGRTTCWW